MIVLLQAYAFFLAWLHGLGGVQTDEAKYLLNIPYPHPPLLRWIMGQTASWSFQEMFWRVVLATLVVQAVWLVWDMTRGLPRAARVAVSVAWLLSPSILLQGGTIMLGPVTAFAALLMLWVLLRQRQGMAVMPEIWGFLWAFALLTAYQGVTLLPLAIAGAMRSSGSAHRKAAAVILPLVLLMIVTLTNPFAVATMILHGEEGARMTLGEHARGAFALWMIAGAGIASFVGTLGLIASRRWEILSGFALTILFILTSAPFPFYGILFLPWLVEGVRFAFIAWPKKADIAAIVFFVLYFLNIVRLSPGSNIPVEPSLARETMWIMKEHVSSGEIAIAGSFGHQWQYESPLPVRRYVPGKLDGVSAVVCLHSCEEPGAGWKKIDAGVDMWIRRS